jgi:ABC-type Mn2+/Zn2+ transport system ATPase subunit
MSEHRLGSRAGNADRAGGAGEDDFATPLAKSPRPVTGPARQPLLATTGLAVGYKPGAPVLQDVTFDLQPAERIAILGPNGGGKTTLFKALLRELPRAAGTLTVTASCASVPQTERSRLDFPVSALDVVLMGTIAARPWWRGPSRADREAARSALERVDLADGADQTFGALSGGQRQRVLIARALVQDARILLFDEPFTGLDAASAARLEALLAELAAAGRGVLIATHDLEQAQRWDRVLCLNRRQVAFGAPMPTLTHDVLTATYGGAIVTLPGEDPNAPHRAIVPPHHHHHEHPS